MHTQDSKFTATNLPIQCCCTLTIYMQSAMHRHRPSLSTEAHQVIGRSWQRQDSWIADERHGKCNCPKEHDRNYITTISIKVEPKAVYVSTALGNWSGEVAFVTQWLTDVSVVLVVSWVNRKAQLSSDNFWSTGIDDKLGWYESVDGQIDHPCSSKWRI